MTANNLGVLNNNIAVNMIMNQSYNNVPMKLQ